MNIITPSEAKVAQSMYVAAEICRINNELGRGFRAFYVPFGIADAMVEELERAGWCAKVVDKTTGVARIEVIEDKS